MPKKPKLQLPTVAEAYFGSTAAITRRVYDTLRKLGSDGHVAQLLLAAAKASSRAKQQRRSKYREHAYARKEAAIAELCELLPHTNLLWGWSADEAVVVAPYVIYVELPDGQVSFHSPRRGKGPCYRRKWDGQYASEDRIIAYAQSQLMSQTNQAA